MLKKSYMTVIALVLFVGSLIAYGAPRGQQMTLEGYLTGEDLLALGVGTVPMTGEYHFEVPDGGQYNKHLWVASPAVLVEISTGAVRLLCESGRVCEVVGHNWASGRPAEIADPETGIGFSYCDLHPNTTYRTCRTCGKCQSQTLEWR